MKLIIARHGQCVANVEGVVAGARVDSPLTPKGRDDAKALLRRLRDDEITVDYIVSSPLSRAYETAQIIAQGLSYTQTIEKDEHFIELDVGDATGLPLDEYFALERSGAEIPGAEAPGTFFARVSEGLKNMKQKHADKTVLLVAHNGTCRMIECVVGNRPAAEFSEIPSLANGDYTIFDI